MQVPLKDIATWHAANNSTGDDFAQQQQQQQQNIQEATPSNSSSSSSSSAPLDWKGEPMKINPGDVVSQTLLDLLRH